MASLLSPADSDRLRRTLPSSWIVREVNLATLLADLAARAGGSVLLNPADIHGGAFEELISRCAKAAAKMVLCHSDTLGLEAQLLVSAVCRANVEILATSIVEGASYLKALVGLKDPSVPTQVLRLAGPDLLQLHGRDADNAVQMPCGCSPSRRSRNQSR